MADEEPPVGDDAASAEHGMVEKEEVEELEVSNPLDDLEKQDVNADETEDDQNTFDVNTELLDATEENELVLDETSDEVPIHETLDQIGDDDQPVDDTNNEMFDATEDTETVQQETLDKAPSHEIAAETEEDLEDKLQKSPSAEPLRDEVEENPDEEDPSMERTAQFAEPSKEDEDDDTDEPAFPSKPDEQDEKDDDEVGTYATPLSPDSVQEVTKEQTAEAPEGDEADVVPDRLGPTCPGVPPPPELFSDGGRDGLRTPPVESMLSNVLNLVWSFGQNRNIPVVNLSTTKTKSIFYVCGHTGIVHDFASNQQTVLQGHANDISCTCVSFNKRWIVTADKGKDNLVIVWDSSSGTPVKTFFDAHADGGVTAVALTPDARYLATLSAAVSQTLAIWDWTTDTEIPICTAQLLPSFGHQNYINFHQDDITQLVTNSDSQVLFYSWKGGVLEYFAPPLTDEDFNKPVGKFNQTLFLSDSSRCLSSTSLGNIVIWETNKLTPTKSSDKIADKRALKIIRVQDAAIYVFTMTDQYIVTGDSHGQIRFFDQSLQMVNWYHDFHLGPVNSVSFAYSADFHDKAPTGNNYPPDATIKALPFVVRDFIVGTTNAVYAHVSVDGTDVKIINRDFDAVIHALATHPTVSVLAAGSHSGLLKLWQYKRRIVIVSRMFDRGQSIRCCAFDPLGQILAIGFGSGTIRLVDALSLEDVAQQPLRFTHDAITHIVFSHDSQYLATADAGFAISVFKKTNNIGQPFAILGRYRSHYKTVKDLSFGMKLDSNGPRLLSLGEDRFLVEYDLENSSNDNLRILSSDRIEQSGIGQCLMWYPPITKESFILTANDQFKFKLYNSTTKMCRKTVLGPTYGSPIQKMVLIPTENEVTDKRYMAYAIRDKVGLVILPLDGNPHNSSAVIAHPRGVSNIAISHDGRHMFTSGGPDATVHMWTINLRALEVQARLGGEDLIPFYGLLEGGREGPLFREMENLFYYAQIRSQGVDAEETREVTDTISVSEIPFLMRALGYYPTEQEIEEMLNEVKFVNYVETGELATQINLGDFIKLYVNHRPAFGLDMNQLKWAFEVLGFKSDNTLAIDRDQLIELLQDYGEHMTDQELAEHLSTLVGFNPEGGSCEHEDLEIEAIDDIIQRSFPETITVDMFADELLGFQMCKSDELEKKALSTPEPGRS